MKVKTKTDAKEVKISSWSSVLHTKTRIVRYNRELTTRIVKLDRPFIPRGSGRSYGDAAYLTDGYTITSGELRKIGKVDLEHGTIECESGVQMVDLYDHLENTDWSFPVAGGTQWVTIGGAVASDIHGKNDTTHGSFGNNIKSILILTARGEVLECSKTVNSDLFAATIGGMGLTGFMRSVKLKLQRTNQNVVHAQTKEFRGVTEMFECFDNIESNLQVAWIDLSHSLSQRGLYHYASYVDGSVNDISRPITLRLPRVKLFNRYTVRLMNAIRYTTDKNKNKITHVRNFHYPVDLLKYWNSFYGRKGFHEYQFVVGNENAQHAISEFFKDCTRLSLPPFFAVVKKFGGIHREGLLSFPREGYTLMGDFENRAENQQFFEKFTDFILDLGGRTYLAKDSYTTKEQFNNMYDNLDTWREITSKYDPDNKIRSDLSVRLNMKPW